MRHYRPRPVYIVKPPRDRIGCFVLQFIGFVLLCTAILNLLGIH